MQLLLKVALYLLSLYDVSYINNAGQTKRFAQFSGKKLLIVNIATGSDKVGQLAELKQLQQQFADSLTVIAFPSNSFGNEARTNDEILEFCNQQYEINFLLCAKGNVTGAEKESIFLWLADVTMNGSMNAPVRSDFQKFLIDKDGTLIGSFSSLISPLDNKIISAITQ
jgi:glutathione peroxidase